MSRLKSSSSSKSERAMVSSVHAVLAMASVDRSERSKIAISPKHAPGFSTARASSPDPGIVREILTSPSRIRNNRLPGSPSLNTCCVTANFCSRQTSATRASSPSSRSWKIAACLSRLRSTRRSYDAREGGASETVGDVGGSAYGASRSSGRGVPVRALARVAAGARRRGRRVRLLRRDAGAALRQLARGRRAGAGHCRGAGVRGVVAATAADGAARSGRRQGRDRTATADPGGVHHRVAAGAATRLGHGGGRTVRDLGLRPRGRAESGAAGARETGGATPNRRGVMRSACTTTLLAMLVAATPLGAQEFHPPAVRRSSDHGTRLGLFGFGVRSGVDLSGNTQLVLGVTLDAGNLASSRLRLRPSGEIGVFNGDNTYIGSFEALYRFTSDDQAATPYAGGGLSIAGHARRGNDPDCPALWINAVVGVEIHYRSTFNWLLEYHPMDAFQHNRLYAGLTTRRGS